MITKIDIIKFAIAILMLFVIQYFSIKKFYIASALIASVPVFTIFAYSLSSQPHQTALYLAVFTLAISITMFIVYFSRSG